MNSTVPRPNPGSSPREVLVEACHRALQLLAADAELDASWCNAGAEETNPSG